jgi:aminomethyltransferase
MKTTPLTDVHIALGAKMAEFAGYNMPISYKGIKEEHATVRNGVGVFDVSHMGEFIVKGADAAAFVHYFTSNDVHKLAIGAVQYSCFPNKTGGIVDDLLVYRLPEDRCAAGEQAFMLVVNASNIDKDWNWIHQGCPFKEVSVRNISDETALLAVQGPRAAAALQSLTDIDLGAMQYYTFAKGRFAGIDNVIVSATGYTGAGGFELYVDNADGAALWQAIFEAGAAEGIQPIGLGARDTLRLEKGFCLYGNDIDDTTSPLEAGLAWITKLKSKQKDNFLAYEWLTQQKEQGVTRKLVGFKMIDRGIPRHDYLITDSDENPMGVVCSGTQSPTLGEGIGLGYVPIAYATIGSLIYIQVRDKYLKAEVVKIPFL